MTVPVERTGVTTFRGKPVTLLGPEVKVGDKAPDFTVIGAGFAPVTFADTRGRVRLFSAVPSLDTEVCDLQTRRFTKEAAALDGVDVWTISVDLPFAQQRWCGAAELEDVRAFSDHRDLSFGLAYGAVVAEFRLLARSVFVVDADDIVVYAEYVPEIGQHPSYDAALEALRQAANRAS